MPDRKAIMFNSCKILEANIKWMLNSDIRIKDGSNRGALYGWKNLKPRPSFPFIYSEITGYAITFYSWIFSEYANKEALEYANEAASWITGNLHSDLLFARPPANKNQPNQLSNLLYSFDNGMVLIGLVGLYKITRNSTYLKAAIKITETLVKRFFDGEKLVARLDSSFKPVDAEEEKDVVKWSTVAGPYHCKLSLALLQLSSLTCNPKYARISDILCNYAIASQKSDGRFITNPGSDVIYLHPHLYSCEGLIYSGIIQSNKEQYTAGINGIKWAIRFLINGGKKSLRRDTRNDSPEQSDCTAQLLRLAMICNSELQKSVPQSDLINTMERLHVRLLDYFIPSEEGQGAMRYQFGADTACSWCTMFSAQALRLCGVRNQGSKWLDYFV